MKHLLIFLSLTFFFSTNFAQVVDVHLHAVSELLTKNFYFIEPQSGEQLLAEMDANHVDMGFVLSNAYVYFFAEEFGVENVREGVEYENNFIIDEAAKAPSRLIAFCSFPMDLPWIFEEIDRCAGRGAKGIKIHLANHNMDLAEEKWAVLYEQVLEKAANNKMMVLVHPYLSGTVKSIEALFFISAFAETPVIFAHGLDPDWRFFQVFNTFADRSLFENIYIDISAFFVNYPKAPRSLRQEIMWHLRQAGTSHLLFGSDFPYYSMSQTFVEVKRFSRLRIGRQGFNRKEREMLFNTNAMRLLESVGMKKRP